MTSDDPRSYYDAEYAAAYDADWQESEAWAREAEHHVDTLETLITTESRWLDVGCGTGWFLARFPGVARAGVDYSGAMVERAAEANPDALFVRQGDAREDVEEWHDGWDLVTCTGQPYSYFRTMDEIEGLAANLAAWTRPDGTCLVTVCDLLDLTGHQPRYHFRDEVDPEHAYSIDATIWSFRDSTGTVHRDMIWVSLHVWVRWFSRWFRTIDVHHWPKDLPQLNAPRRYLVLRDKREGPDDGAPATITVHPPLEASDGPAEESPPEAVDDLPAEPADPDPVADAAVPTAVPGDRPVDRVDPPATATATPRVTTAALARELAHRLSPTNTGAWRRRLGRARRRFSGAAPTDAA